MPLPEAETSFLEANEIAPADYQVVAAIYEGLYARQPHFGLSDMLAFLKAHPDIAALNGAVVQKAARL